jgi:hypothetical protein
LLLAAVVLQAQDQPTFRTGANYVRVDMYASLDGKSVDDLTAEEVEVLEDNLPQKLEAFEHVQVRPAEPQEARREPNTVEQSRQMAAEARARVFVIFLDTYHTTIEGSANMRLPLIKFLDRLVGPDDLVALMTPEMGASEITLGRKTTVISNIMQAQWMWGRHGRIADNDPKEDLYESCYGVVNSATAKEMKARRREACARRPLRSDGSSGRYTRGTQSAGCCHRRLATVQTKREPDGGRRRPYPSPARRCPATNTAASAG